MRTLPLMFGVSWLAYARLALVLTPMVLELWKLFQKHDNAACLRCGSQSVLWAF